MNNNNTKTSYKKKKKSTTEYFLLNNKKNEFNPRQIRKNLSKKKINKITISFY